MYGIAVAMSNSLIIRSGECKKFSPNIFNKTKCTNCFRQKEEHSAEALESNRATRKVAKCGYLFVAPGWDFSNPVNRTKRWQRRWFVLYDDGELSYSVDEHPETVPQACIDMNKVIDVSDAEELTGNPYSLAISTEDGAHFVKATCREEAKWWMDMLTVFPKSKSRIKRTAAYSVVTKTVPTSVPGNNSIGPQTAQLKSVSRPNINSSGGGGPVKEICSRYIWAGNSDSLQSCSSSLDSESAASNRKEIQKTPRICSEVCSTDKARNRRLQITREKQRIVKSATEPRTSFKQEDILPSWHDKKSTSDVSRRLLIEDFNVECKMKDVPDAGTPHSRHSSSSFSSNQDLLRDVDISAHKQVRGDPDGCGLDLSTLRYSPSSELRMEPISEDLLNIKKGWLMKQGHDQQEWHKHWFVLRGSALLYYRDPTAEDQGILDGVIDLSVMNNISEVQVARNYGFQITSWDEKRYVLSAVTAGIRINWITAIKRAAGLQDDSSSIADADKEIPSTPRSMLLSSDEEYRTASENGRRESSSDWGETLPPSPPLNRTPISRVKERARGVTRTRIYNSRNSKSSPPSSRRSTLDSIRHDVLTPCVEVNLQEKTDRSLPMSKKLEKQAIELEDVKRQLTSALRQLSSAEEELLRLRQRQQDIAALEKQMADVMQSLKRAEEALNQKSCELSDYESFKKRYVEEKTAWDEELRVTECELHDTEERYSELCCELATSREHVDQLRTELAIVKERLTRGIEENESLYRRIRELEGRTVPPSSMRESKGRSLDSLSDLTNIDFDLDVGRLDKERLIDEYENVRVRFEKAVQEIKAMKKELRESHTQTDCLEISLINARQQLKSKQQFYESQATMMAARIEDLTGKLFSAEKQIRSLKQKLSKSENREKKRSLSLKGRESYAMCKELEEKLLLLERKISVLNGEEVSQKNKPSVACNEAAAQQRTGEIGGSTCKEALSSKMRRKSLDSAISSEPMKILIRMNCLEAKVAQASQNVLIKQSDECLSSTNEETVDEDSPERSAILNEARNIENLLRKKLTDIYAKQRSLRDTGRLTNEGKLNIMAEKLAYESVLICRLHDILSGSNDLDVADTERLMNELDRKLNGEQFVTKTSLEYFASSLSQYLMQIGRASDKCAAKRKRSHVKYRDKNSAIAKTLQKKSSVLSRRVNEFIRENAEELLSAAVTSDGSSVDENDNERFESVKELVRESVNQRLIQAEITQLMLHCTSGAGYAPICKAEKQSDGRSMEYLMMDRANLEQWTDNAMNVLNGEVDNAIELLKEKYRQKLSGWPNKKAIVGGHAKGNSSNVSLLQQFVDIIAHKVLLDARLAMISRKNELTHSSDGHRNENSDTTDGNLSALDEAAIVAEVQFLYAKLQNELQLSNDEKRVFDSLDSVGTEVSALCSSVEDLFRKRSFSENSCIEWKDERGGKYDDSNSSSESSWLDGVCRKCTEIKEQIINLQSCLSQSPECQKCLFLQDQLQKKEQDYENEKLQLEKQHQDDLLALKNEFENEKKSLINKYEREERLLREKSRKLEKKLDALDSEYTQQMDNLRYSYKSSTSSSYEADCHSKDENVRQRYQEEIEQLRTLCEKGLSAMDNSHRRIIAELEEKHRQEIESLKLEKEQALAEETQATLAALDAMRKAHEAEVQKEISKFKSEYLKKVQSNHDIVAMHKEHEAEMEEIKKEILSLSEKYSTKCVESAALEEELRSANNQLAQAQQHIMQLDSRNKQLRAHLISDAAQEGVVNSELYQQLDEKSKEIIELRKQLTVHDDTLNALYTHLSNGRVDEAVINPLLEKLKCILVNGRRSNTAGLKKKGHRPLQHRSSFCGVNGMVAERKKIFET